MNFKQWIQRFESEDNPVGDLARDISSDGEFPDTNDYEEIKSYLAFKSSGSIREKVLMAFEEVYSLYR